MKEERSVGEVFYGRFITVYSKLTVIAVVWMDTHTQGFKGDVLSPPESFCFDSNHLSLTKVI